MSKVIKKTKVVKVKKVSNAVKKIIGQKSHSEIKNDKLILQSIKIFSDQSLRADTVELSLKSTKAIVSKIKKGDVETFRAKFYALCKSDQLKIDGKSQKAGLCKHARARQHCFNVIAQELKREDLVVNYGKIKAVA